MFLCCFNFISFRFYSSNRFLSLFLRLYQMKTMIHCISPELEMVMRPNVETIHQDENGSENEEQQPKRTKEKPNTNAVDTYTSRKWSGKKGARVHSFGFKKQRKMSTPFLEMRNNGRIKQPTGIKEKMTERERERDTRWIYWKDVTTDRQCGVGPFNSHWKWSVSLKTLQFQCTRKN